MPVARRIVDARERQRIVVSGQIIATESTIVGTSPSYCCELDDTTGVIGLWFIGRERVAGLTEGSWCTIEGTVQERRSRLIVWNPIYRLFWIDLT
jgi:hypothetical protein